MIYVFLIYGLAFFLFGIALWVYPADQRESLITRHLWMVAVFGVVHGLNEWMDLLVLAGAQGQAAIGLLQPFFLAGSFFFLLLFGVCTLPRRHLCLLPLLLGLLWLGVTTLSGWGSAASNDAARYLLGIPGAGLTAWAFWVHADSRPETPRLNVRRMQVIAGAFGVYALLAGAVVSPADFPPASWLNTETFLRLVGVPVQLFRAACAVVLAHQLLRILETDRRSTLRQIEEHRRTLEQRVRERTAELQENLERVRVLSGMLPICAWCKKIRSDEGYWSEVEVFLTRHSDADFSHGICPDCQTDFLSKQGLNAPRVPGEGPEPSGSSDPEDSEK